MFARVIRLQLYFTLLLTHKTQLNLESGLKCCRVLHEMSEHESIETHDIFFPMFQESTFDHIIENAGPECSHFCILFKKKLFNKIPYPNYEWTQPWGP